jgi:hypothetical protein
VGEDSEAGRNGGRGPTHCYNCDEQGNLTRDCPLLRRPWCAHCRNNTHATEDYPELISKWEDHVRQCGDNLINFEPQPITEEKEPKINIITRGGTRIGVDIDNPNQSKIQKVVPVDVKYDPLRKNKFFHNNVEMFRQMSKPSISTVTEPSVEFQPRVTKNCWLQRTCQRHHKRLLIYGSNFFLIFWMMNNSLRSCGTCLGGLWRLKGAQRSHCC